MMTVHRPSSFAVNATTTWLSVTEMIQWYFWGTRGSTLRNIPGSGLWLGDVVFKLGRPAAIVNVFIKAAVVSGGVAHFLLHSAAFKHCSLKNDMNMGRIRRMQSSKTSDGCVTWFSELYFRCWRTWGRALKRTHLEFCADASVSHVREFGRPEFGRFFTFALWNWMFDGRN